MVSVSVQCFLLAFVVAAASATQSCKEFLKAELEDADTYGNTGGFFPICDDDDTYSPKQCGPGPGCRCVDAKGHYIRISEDIPNYADEYQCKCARQKNNYMEVVKSGRKINFDLVPVCDDFGNYAKIQCIDHMCYCVHPTYGNKTGTEAVPYNKQNALNCE